MRFFFTTVGLHNPTLAGQLPEHMAYPLSQRVQGGLDLDYTALLLGNQFIIDSAAFAEITQGYRPFLEPMAATLLKLKQSDLLATVDMGAIMSRNKQAILKKTELLLENPLIWLADMRRQWKIVKPEFEEFQASFGHADMMQQNTGHCGVENWLAEIGEYDNHALRGRIMQVLESRRTRLSEVETEFIRGSMKFLVAQILSTDLLRYELSVPFLDWDDAQPFYDRLYATRWDETALEEAAIYRQARILFDFVVPELRPSNVDEVIRFVQDDRAVRSMRSELFQRVAEGTDVSKEWFTRYVNQAFKRELVSKDRVRKFRWLGSLAGVILPGASLAEEIALELGINVAESAVNGTEGSYYWYYALQRAAMRRETARGLRTGPLISTSSRP